MAYPRPYRGVFPVAPTIFHEDGTLDLDGQRRCIDFMIDAGSAWPVHPRQLLRAVRAHRRGARADHGRGPSTMWQAACRSSSPRPTSPPHLCRAQQAGPGCGCRDGDDHAALSRRHHPRVRAGHLRLLQPLSRCHRHPDHDPGRTRRRHAALRAASRASMAKEIRERRLLQDRGPLAAAKLRDDARTQGGEAIEGPWDGEEAITLMADLDAGATGSMTGGGYPDGIRTIIDPWLAGGPRRGHDRLRALAAR
jgi:2-keto-3-deoxy-L-arabinonate dehydratase